MKFFNTLMAVIGWIVTIGALLTLFGIGSMAWHLGPMHFHMP